jgi:acetylornithine/N-succinyldiaminopimelate aminotransferase
MIGFDVSEELKDLRKNLLYQHNIFTGEAKPNIIRLLPALTISRKQIEEFLEALTESVEEHENAKMKQ